MSGNHFQGDTTERSVTGVQAPPSTSSAPDAALAEQLKRELSANFDMRAALVLGRIEGWELASRLAGEVGEAPRLSLREVLESA